MSMYENYFFVSDLVWFLNLESKISDEGGKSLGTIKKGIEVKDVWFKYRNDGEWILRGVSTFFNKGEKVAIVGENGAGKSTLMKLHGFTSVVSSSFIPNRSFLLALLV